MSYLSSALSRTSGPQSWAQQPTTAFGQSTASIAVLPVYGMGDHGLGLSLDLEETIGDAILAASQDLNPNVDVTILPPLRAGLSPYRPSHTALPADALLKIIGEIAEGVQSAGFSRLVFWSTSPWNIDLIDVASRDVRVELDLQTFVIPLAGVGLSLHPRDSDRARAQIIGAALTGSVPEETSTGMPVDLDFRPGNWSQLPPLSTTMDESAENILTDCASRLGMYFQEIRAHGSPADLTPSTPDVSAVISESLSSSLSYPGPRRGRYFPALSAQSLAGLADKSAKLVIIPIGAIEQHGPHLPVGVDAMIAEAAAQGLSNRLSEDVWCAPTLCYGKSNEHRDFPGTISLSAASLRQVVKSQVNALHDVGFRQFALLNTHGGNSAVLTYILRELQTELKVRAGMLRLSASDELESHERAWGFHAGEWETSVMLAIAPETVNMSKAICHYPVEKGAAGNLRPENAPVTFSWKTRDIAPEGVMGDATKASATKGIRWFYVALDQVADQIRRLLQRA